MFYLVFRFLTIFLLCKYAQEGTSKGKGEFSSSRNVSKSKEPKIILYLDTNSDDLKEIRGRSRERKSKDVRGRSREIKRKDVRRGSRSRDFATPVLQNQSERAQSKKRRPKSRRNQFNRKNKDD